MMLAVNKGVSKILIIVLESNTNHKIAPIMAPYIGLISNPNKFN